MEIKDILRVIQIVLALVWAIHNAYTANKLHQADVNTFARVLGTIITNQVMLGLLILSNLML